MLKQLRHFRATRDQAFAIRNHLSDLEGCSIPELLLEGYTLSTRLKLH